MDDHLADLPTEHEHAAIVDALAAASALVRPDAVLVSIGRPDPDSDSTLAQLAAVRRRYDPAGRLTDLYDKVVRTP